jgi:D-alanyl-D-alanine carboxypeptidase/D-alanyl-D-alanine-endopeptidase (penicillin-binding protein 4)
MSHKFFLPAVLCLLVACTPKGFLKKELASSEKKFKEHIGFMLYDPESKRTLFEFNSDKYFTPASNTKIFTFYTALQILGDSVPALKYKVTQDSLIFWGTGDPSFLYSQSFNNSRVYDFLKSTPQKLFFSNSNFTARHFGPGWAWDDYLYPYSSERSSFPILGNFAEVSRGSDSSFIVHPQMFSRVVNLADSVNGRSVLVRGWDTNQITFFPGRDKANVRSWQLPFHVTPEVITTLLSDTLKRKVELVHFPLTEKSQTLYSVKSDSLYKTMMQVSDNFIAEQLLLTCAGVVSDTLDQDIAIRHAKKNFLFDLPDEPVWVDGSGLSRYNLFTPRSIVRLWEKIYYKVPRERLFSLLATGSKSGTIRNWYKADKPYIFGKTGSLSNNHALSGYLVTQKGKVLIFSFMNSNFISSPDEIRKMMQGILLRVRNEF